MTKDLIKNIAIAIHKQVNCDRVDAWLTIDFRENETQWIKVAEKALEVINADNKTL